MRRWLSLARIGLSSTLGGGTLPVLGVVAALAVYGFGYAKGAQGQRAGCHAAELEATVERQRADLRLVEEQLRAASEARDVARAHAARDAAIMEREREEADAFKQELATRANHCPISSADAERLRRIGQ